MNRYVLLDYIRGVAALLVCVGHLRAALLVDHSQWASPHLGQHALYFLTSLGHQAVMIFFVLSGYLVGGSVLASMSSFSWLRYGIARLSRLWVVLLPCLVLTWIVDEAILRCAPDVLSGFASDHWHSGPKSAGFDRSYIAWLGNVVFLQTIAVPVFGSNGPLWSLANEFWYYVCFPLLLASFGPLKNVSPRHRILSTLILVLLAVCIPLSIVQGFVVWLMGAGVAHALRSGWVVTHHELHRWTSIGLLVFGVVASWFCQKRQIPVSGDLLLGACFAAFLLVHLNPSRTAHANAAQKGFVTENMVRLSDMSFSLYLSHFPLVLAFGAAFSMNERMQPTWEAWVVLLMCLCVLLIVGRMIWWAFERRTDSIRRQIFLLFNPVSPSA